MPVLCFALQAHYCCRWLLKKAVRSIIIAFICAITFATHWHIAIMVYDLYLQEIVPTSKDMMKPSELIRPQALDVSITCPHLTPAASAFPAACEYIIICMYIN